MSGGRLYDAVGLGLAAYARTRFRIRVVGEPFALEPGALLVASHRSDADVPVAIGALYRPAHGLLRRGSPVHFAVRDDLFVPGFFGGYPDGLPEWARRLLFPVAIGGILKERLPCHPIRSANRMRLAELLREHPDARVEELLPDDMLRPFRERGLAADARAADALAGRYADLLWHLADREELRGPLAAESWGRRAAAATADFRELVDLVRGGEPLLLFPEGRPSPDGELGPVQRGLAALVRRARPSGIRPLAFAYDPLTRGRPYACVGVGPIVDAPLDERQVLALLRRTTPLTAGQLVAAGDDDRVGEAVEAALAEGRPVVPELLDPEQRGARLAEAREAAGQAPLERLVREYRSARHRA